MSQSIETKTKTEISISDLKPEDFTEIFNMVANMLDSYGDFAISFSDIETKYGEYLDLMKDLYLDPSFIEKVIAEAHPEIVKTLMGILFKLFNALQMLTRLMELSPMDKRKLGINLKSIAKDFRELKSL